jgi:hypothetical protein
MQNWFIVGMDLLFLSLLAFTVISGRASRVPENVLGVYARFLAVRLLIVAPLGLIAWLGVTRVTGSPVAGGICAFTILFGGYLAEIWWFRRRESSKTD